jgi:quercetin dioxygenase-like cupin family protein
VDVWKLEARDIRPGYHGRFVHTEHTTHAYWEIDAGSPLEEHAHPHEQIVNLLEGSYELIMNGQSHLLGPGDVLVIPGDVPHAGLAHTDCRILDVFSPVREDYR